MRSAWCSRAFSFFIWIDHQLLRHDLSFLSLLLQYSQYETDNYVLVSRAGGLAAGHVSKWTVDFNELVPRLPGDTFYLFKLLFLLIALYFWVVVRPRGEKFGNCAYFWRSKTVLIFKNFPFYMPYSMYTFLLSQKYEISWVNSRNNILKKQQISLSKIKGGHRGIAKR